MTLPNKNKNEHKQFKRFAEMSDDKLREYYYTVLENHCADKIEISKCLLNKRGVYY